MKKALLCLIAFAIINTAQSQSWLIAGNSNINPTLHFLGTTNNQPLKFRINNQYAGEMDSVNGKTFFGYGAGKSSSGTDNTAFGFKALNSNTTGIVNTAIGSSALQSNTTAIGNVAVGFRALKSNTTGFGNTGLGSYTLESNTTATYNTAVGYVALNQNTTGSYNTATGSEALLYNTTGSNNTANGTNSLHVNTTGNNNTATGYSALSKNTTGYYNTAYGSVSLESNTTGSYNTAYGMGSLWGNTTGGENTAAGFHALSQNTTGYSNTSIGYEALYYNSTAFRNTVVGDRAMFFSQTGSYNTANGYGALFLITQSSYNTAIGYNAGGRFNLGSNNTMLGANSDGSFMGQSNFIAIGQGVTCTANNSARIGNSAITSIGGYVGWTNFSDGRYKKNIQENVKGLEFIMKLRPVTYNLDITGASKKTKENAGEEWDAKIKEAITEKEKTFYSGFVAQEVEQAAKETGYDFSGVDKPGNENGVYGLRYAEFVVPLVKAMQEQQQIINDLQKRIAELERKDGSNLPSDNSNKLSVWPNPSNDIVTVSIVADNGSQASIKIFDSKGALVKQQQTTILQGNNQIKIDMKGLARGTYLVSAEWNNGRVKNTTSIIKQ